MVANKMRWRSMVQCLTLFLSSMGIVLLTVLPEPASCVPQKVIPFARMNQSLQDHLLKHKFLEQLKGKLFQNDNFLRNSTSSSGQPRGTNSPRSQEHTQFSGTLTQVQLLYNLSVVDRLVTDTLPIPKDYISKISPPSLVQSESLEKNVLLFRFKPNTVRNNTHVNRINLWLYVWTKENNEELEPSAQSLAGSPSPNTRDLKSDQRRGKIIKIRVFLSDETGLRGQQIAELKTRIKSSSWGKLGLPVSLINSLAESETLRLRIECKRCTSKTQVVLPGNSDAKRCRKQQKTNKKKKKKNRIRRWRKHCSNMGANNAKLIPFIVIEEKSRSFNGRFKRTVNTKTDTGTARLDCHNYSKSGFRSSDKTSSSSTFSIEQCCTPFKTFVNFADLNLDRVIIYPPGIELASCSDECLEPTTSFLDNVKRNLERHLRLPSSKMCQINVGSSNHSSLVCREATSPRHQHSRQPLQHKYHRHSQRVHWHKHKLSRLKATSRACFPVESQNLMILHFTHEHKLAHFELPRMLTTRCGCRSHLPLIKD